MNLFHGDAETIGEPMVDIAREVLANVFITLGGIFLLTHVLPLLSRWKKHTRQLMLGPLFGLVVVASMSAAFPIAGGVYGDLRNAIIAVAAIAVGPIAAIVCAAVALVFRIALGGQVIGAVVGIALSTILSLVFCALPLKKTAFNLAQFGVVLAVANALLPLLGVLMGTMTVGSALMIAGAILAASLILYPLGIMLMAKLLQREVARLDLEANLVARNQELSVSERRFRDVFDLSCVPMAWIDLGTRRFIRVNQEYELFSGYSAAELLTMTVDQMSIAENRQDDVNILDSLTTGDTTSIIGERPYRRKDGSIRWGNRTLTATPDASDTKLGLAIVQDVTDQRRGRELVAFLAEHDTLTSLGNRYSYGRELEAALSQQGMVLAVLLMDLDDFKSVNDTRGHAVGDQVLQHVADALSAHLRPDDVVARIGGDEFAIVRRGIAAEEALALAEQLIAVVGRPTIIRGQMTSIGATMGIAMSPEDGIDPAELLKKADIALYASKSGGKGTPRLFDAVMEKSIVQREEIRAHLAVALTNSELEVEYQPLIDIPTMEVCGFEALLRWNHPNRGRIPPTEFIPVLEENQSIIAVGAWVLQEACSVAAKWPHGITVAVNVSVRQFEPTLPLRVAAALAMSGLSAGRLQLEITESVLMLGSDEPLSILRQIKQLGVGIALDDFGTGFSSLSYLQKFPFDKLKVDKSFVQGADSNEQSRKITRSMVQLGRSLGMRVTAEGVETADQLERMRNKGCDEAQGYLFSRSVRASEVPDLLARLSLVRTENQLGIKA
jgi:diguanylate cyclase (GGDEF)-like protein/PAS domain S-box-containing protein